ncbi:LacI family DNA-binding transcriptional regulator [Marinomonas fungiae]|uniref:Transcriptional regulator, LacI family n=1 Tax=Marinomonas fungiae TaxID=1137284 RepID=A0A0K6IJ12_9GAMM|nr:LacI family DNA-binding transcriptional regulator [Marinomonas fungiae]CUB03337.1 transcriptional regulator, LacI family [Marinomonas fungiae]
MNKVAKHRNITAQDVADYAGVSRAVVSRALSENGSIAPETKAKVIKAAQELGYQVNFLAQGLNRKRSQLIGVVVARISDPFRSALLEGLISEIQARGYQALITEVQTEQDLADTMRRFSQFRVSGVVVTSGQPPQALVKECVEFKIPVVGINRQLDIPQVDAVYSDNQQGAQLVCEHLITQGCKSFGWLNYKGSTWSGLQRGAAFSQALLEQGLNHRLTNIEAPCDGYEGGQQAAFTLLENQPPIPQGIFCANAQLACGFLDGMRQQGFDAPQNFKLVGFDNTPQTEQWSYQLSTLDQNIDALCKSTLDCLESRTHLPNKPSCSLPIAVQLIERKSSLSLP